MKRGLRGSKKRGGNEGWGGGGCHAFSANIHTYIHGILISMVLVSLEITSLA